MTKEKETAKKPKKGDKENADNKEKRKKSVVEKEHEEKEGKKQKKRTSEDKGKDDDKDQRRSSEDKESPDDKDRTKRSSEDKGTADDKEHKKRSSEDKGNADDKEHKKRASEDKGKAEDKEKEKPKVVPKKPPKKEKVEIFSDVLVKAFSPFRILLLVFGRIPVGYKRKAALEYVFTSSLNSPIGIYFLITTAILFYILLVGTWNLFVIVMDVHLTSTPSTSEARAELIYEKIIIERHLVTFILTWTSLIHSVIASVNIFLKKEYMANYFSFWTRAVDTMYMNVARGTYRYSLIICSSFVSVLFILAFMSFLKWGPSTVGGPTMMFMLMFRHLVSEPYLNVDSIAFGSITKRAVFQFIGGFFFLFVFISSKVYIFVFLFKCKLLRNAFANWNGRVYAAVLRGGDFTQSDRGRTTYSLLFKDHCILLDLMEGTDRLFSMIIESYFGLQVVSICFEGYFFVRAAKITDKQADAYKDGTYFLRPFDWAPGLIILMQSVFILIVVSKAAAEVGEEALAGLEVIRRKTMLGRRTDEELYFMLSMFSSYTAYKKLELSGGGYFYLDKEFIIGIVSTIFSYFIIIYQFQPILDYKPQDNEITRCQIGLFLHKFEGIDKYHWAPNATPMACVPLTFGPIK